MFRMNSIPVSNDLQVGHSVIQTYIMEKFEHTTEKAFWIYVFVLTSLVLRTSIMTRCSQREIAPKWVLAEATDWESTLESIRVVRVGCGVEVAGRTGVGVMVDRVWEAARLRPNILAKARKSICPEMRTRSHSSGSDKSWVTPDAVVTAAQKLLPRRKRNTAASYLPDG